MPNRILNSTNILYTPNIEDVKKYNYYASPNTFIISSYYNSGSYIGFDYYQGLSYELYYVDQNKNIQQLTYNFVKGNGLSIKDNKFEIKLDNKTLTLEKYKNKNYVKVNINAFKEASYLNRGVLTIENGIYYNDKYYDLLDSDGAFKLDNSNRITLSNGLTHDLENISLYYKKCTDIIKKVNELYLIAIKDLNVAAYVEVGDILYYNSKKKIYTLNKSNKDGTNNVPSMVCVIASNVLPDFEPRFMPLKRNMEQFIFDKSSTMYIKNALNTVPIYNISDTTKINTSTNIKGANRGYIAVKRNDWSKNIKNPLDSSENYYTLNAKSIIYNTSSIVSSQTLNWYIDASKINYNNNYTISNYGVYTDILNETIKNKIGNTSVYVILTINFNNNVVKYYLCNLKVNNNRLININTLYGYSLMKTITNNFTEISTSSSESSSILLSKEMKELSSSSSESNNGIHFTTLKPMNVDFSESSNNATETYVISHESEILSDSKVYITTVSHTNNTYTFTVTASIYGKIDIITTAGTLNIKSLIVEPNKPTNKITVTNNTVEMINTTINVYLSPNDTTKYKSTSTKIQVSIAGKHKEINNTLINAITNNTNNLNTKMVINKKPTNGYVISNNQLYNISNTEISKISGNS